MNSMSYDSTNISNYTSFAAIIEPFLVLPACSHHSISHDAELYYNPLLDIKIDSVTVDGKPVASHVHIIDFDELDTSTFRPGKMGHVYLLIVELGITEPSTSYSLLTISSMSEVDSITEYPIPREFSRMELEYRTRYAPDELGPKQLLVATLRK